MTDNRRKTEKKRDPLDGLKGIVFDLDDTLYLQKDFKISGFHAVADWMKDKGYGRRQDITETLFAILEHHGPSYPFMFDRLVEQASLPKTLVPELVQVFTRHPPVIELFSGVSELLTCLRPRFKLGILTDGQVSVQQAKVRALGLEPFVDRILYSSAMGLSKPAAQLFTWFEEKFGLPGEYLAYVADNPTKDFIGAHQRGWTTIRVLTGEFAGIVAQNNHDAAITLSRATCLCFREQQPGDQRTNTHCPSTYPQGTIYHFISRYHFDNKNEL